MFFRLPIGRCWSDQVQKCPVVSLSIRFQEVFAVTIAASSREHRDARDADVFSWNELPELLAAEDLFDACGTACERGTALCANELKFGDDSVVVVSDEDDDYDDEDDEDDEDEDDDLEDDEDDEEEDEEEWEEVEDEEDEDEEDEEEEDEEEDSEEDDEEEEDEDWEDDDEDWEDEDDDEDDDDDDD